jgi:hypothetical protein
MTLEGSKELPVPSQCSGGFDSCTGGGTESVTWTLVRTKKLELNKLQLFDRDPLYGVRTKPEQRGHVQPKEFTPLQFLSASPHPWGGTRVCMAIELDGFAEDLITSFDIDVKWGDTKATFSLGLAGFAGIVGEDFHDGPVAVTKPGDFCVDMAAAKFRPLNQTNDGKLTFTVRVGTDWGDQVTKTYSIEKLVRYMGANRFGNRDAGYGGDSWLKPHVVKWLANVDGIGNRTSPAVKFKWDDMSNMNGGRFYPHAAHRDGLDVEGTFAGYHKNYQPTEYAAKVLVALLRTSEGRHIRSIQVGFKQGSGFDAFLRRAARLPDGRDPQAVILRVPGFDYLAKFKIWFKDL